MSRCLQHCYDILISLQARRTQLATHDALKNVAHPSQHYAVACLDVYSATRSFTLYAAHRGYPPKCAVAIHRGDRRTKGTSLSAYSPLHIGLPDSVAKRGNRIAMRDRSEYDDGRDGD